MPYDDVLAARMRNVIGRRNGLTEKKMFGGICFLLNGNIAVGIWKDSLIARTGAESYEETLSQPHVSEFNITGRPMRGWVMIEPAGISRDENLRDWIDRAFQFVKTLPSK